MQFSWIDWVVVAIPLACIFGVALYLKRYVTSVVHFLAGGRLAGRYLISVASGEAAYGLVSAVAWFEIFGKSGLSNNLWASVFAPLGVLLGLLGFVIYRYRETRALTLAQFFEMRYGRRFRLFMGWLIFIAGIVNFGFFPGVGARFFVYYGGLPTTISLLGQTVPTYMVVMALALTIITWFTTSGGQTTVMSLDCLGGIFSQAAYGVICVTLFVLVPWGHVGETLCAGAAGQSIVDPFDNYKISDFSVFYVILSFIISIYSFRAWQGQAGYNSAAKNAHEAKMGVVLGTWRNMTMYLMYGLLATVGLTVLNHSGYAELQGAVQAELANISSVPIQNQMEVPIALRALFPVGIQGLFFVVMMFVMMSTDSSMLHSWGSVFVQDIYMPLRGEKHLPPEKHLRLLRLAIVGVAVFAFLFSTFVEVTDYIFMFQQITGAIYLAGAGALIIGGLYWSRGTTQGAWAASITGALMAMTFIVLQQVWVRVLGHERFPINGQILTLISMAVSLCIYVVVSLLTCKRPYNMDKLLNRGAYAVEAMEDKDAKLAERKWSWARVIGIDRHYTRGDKIIAGAVFGWNSLWSVLSMILLVLFLTGIMRWSREQWFVYGSIAYYLLPAVIGFCTTIWFLWGGSRDFLRFVRDLKSFKADENDDGSVRQERA